MVPCCRRYFTRSQVQTWVSQEIICASRDVKRKREKIHPIAAFILITRARQKMLSVATCLAGHWELTPHRIHMQTWERKVLFTFFSSQIFTYTVGLVSYPLPSASALLLWALSEELHSKGIYVMLPMPQSLSQLVGGVSTCLSGLLFGNQQGEWRPVVNRSSNDCYGKSEHHKGLKRWWLKNAVSKDQ